MWLLEFKIMDQQKWPKIRRNIAPCHPPPPPLLSILHREYKCSLPPGLAQSSSFLATCSFDITRRIALQTVYCICEQTCNICKETGTGLESRSAPGKHKHFKNWEWGHQAICFLSILNIYAQVFLENLASYAICWGPLYTNEVATNSNAWPT